MEVRTLNSERDETLLYEAYSWMERAPEWFYEAHPMFWLPDYVSFREAAKERLDFGVFEDGKMFGLIMLTERATGSYEVDIAACGARVVKRLGAAAFALKSELFSKGVREIFAWVLSGNRWAQKVCEMAGMTRDGVRVLKGVIKGEPAEWVRFACVKEVIG